MAKMGIVAVILGLLAAAAGCSQPAESNAGTMAMEPEPRIDVEGFATVDIDDVGPTQDDATAVLDDATGESADAMADPQIIRPVIIRKIDKSIAVINDQQHPVPWEVIETARETMLAAGCYGVGIDRCEVLIECRQQPRPGEPTTESSYAFSRATYMDPPDPVRYVRPWWVDDPSAARLATVEIVFDVWDEDSQAWRVLREIVIRIGRQGVHSDTFNRADLQALRETLDAWALYYLSR